MDWRELSWSINVTKLTQFIKIKIEHWVVLVLLKLSIA